MHTLDFSRIDARHSATYSPSRPSSSTLCGRVWALRCGIGAYADPAPVGKLGAAERDALAVKLALNWTRKALRGESSCVWHEVAEHYKVLCYCFAPACKARRAERKAHLTLR